MSKRKTLLDFYEEVYYGEQDTFKTSLGLLRLDRYHFQFKIGDFTIIYVDEMHRFPYPIKKKRGPK